MSQKLFRISGRVIDRKTKQGVAGLRVEAMDKDLIVKTPFGSAITDAQGAFLIEIAKGQVRELFGSRSIILFFKVFRDDALLASTEDTVLWEKDSPDQELTIRLRLAEAPPQAGGPFVVQGQAQRESGGPLASGKVRLFGISPGPEMALAGAETDANGRFEFKYNPAELKLGADARLEVRAVDDEGKTLAASPSFAAQAFQTVSLTVPELPPTLDIFIIQGVIRDAEGKQVDNITVQIVGLKPGLERVLGETRTTFEGRYEIDYAPGEFNVRLDGSARLTVRVLSDQGEILAASPLFQSSPIETADLNLPGQARQFIVQGHIRRTDGTAAAQLIVRVFSLVLNQEKFLGQALSDVSGFYKIVYAPPDFASGTPPPLIVVRVLDRLGNVLALTPPFPVRPLVIEDFVVPVEPTEPRPNNQWIILHTGRAVSVTIFIAVFIQIPRQRVVIRELDEHDGVIAVRPFSTLAVTTVTGTTGLPAHWVDPSGPWANDVTPVAQFLASPDFSLLEKLVVTIKPDKRTIKLQIMVLDQTPISPPAVLLGAVEVCSQAEQDRAAQTSAIQSGQLEALTGYLGGEGAVPLLEPNRTYKVRVRYDVESKAADGAISVESDLVQEFQFKTDAAEPRRLDPWVLGTTPDHEERFHFYEDAVKLVFNDASVVQLFNAYGKQLRVEVRAADGVAIPHHQIAPLDLASVPAAVTEPYRAAIKALVDAGLLPCVGSISIPGHSAYTVPITLRPLMAYTLDITVEPPNPVVPDAATTPLYRRSFATSRFASISALINEVAANKIRHRALQSQLAGLPAGAPAATATDEEIQAALRAAGEQALPAASETGLTIYWARRPGSSQFSPHIILIDAAEPLWRMRLEPRLQTVPDQDDPAFQRIVPTPLAALEIIEQAGSNITRFVRSTGGTRTLAVISDSFNPPAGGGVITLALHRAHSELYGISELTEVLIALPLDARAPWESDL